MKTIAFTRTVESQLKCWIISKGLNIHHSEGRQEVSICVVNSRGSETPGAIAIPVQDLPKVIAQLIDLQNELIAAGKIQT